MNKNKKAQQLDEIGFFASPEPLTAATWSQYIPTEEARGSTDVRHLIRQLQSAHRTGTPLRAIFAGHRGCGKSTELLRVSDAVRDLYAGEICRVEERYSLPTLDYRQLLFLCAHSLMDYAGQVQVALSEDRVRSLGAWFDEQTVQEVTTEGQEVAAEAGVNLGYLSLLFAKFSGKIYSGGKTQETVTKHIEQRLDQLMQNMQIVVEAIEERIKPRRLLLILEGLDKIEALSQSRAIFLDHRLQLLSIPCSIIFTFPIRLWYEPDGGTAGYDYKHLLPMIPVAAAPQNRDLTEEEALLKAQRGRDALRAIVLARLESRLIAPDALDHIVRASGGVIRDLLYLVREGALNALDEGRTQITLRDCKLAARKLRGYYAKALSPPSQGSDIKLADMQEALGDPADWPRRDAAPTAAFKLLLQNLCILEYNGDTWHDLHPLVRDHRELIASEQKARQAARSAADKA